MSLYLVQQNLSFVTDHQHGASLKPSLWCLSISFFTGNLGLLT